MIESDTSNYIGLICFNTLNRKFENACEHFFHKHHFVLDVDDLKQSDKVIPRPKELRICENDTLVFCTTMPGRVDDQLKFLHYFIGAVNGCCVTVKYISSRMIGYTVCE